MIEHLTELQYSTDRKGPWILYVYEPASEYHRGGVWFRNVTQYPDEEITTLKAQQLCDLAMKERREIRICDSGDMLVYHAKDGRILFGKNFWSEISR